MENVYEEYLVFIMPSTNALCLILCNIYFKQFIT